MAWFYSIGPVPLFLKVFAVNCLSRAEPFPETGQVRFLEIPIGFGYRNLKQKNIFFLEGY